MTTEEVLQLKKKIDRVTTQYNELTGVMTAQLERLKKEFQCDSLEAARTKLETMETEITQLESSISTQVEYLKKNYPDLF